MLSLTAIQQFKILHDIIVSQGIKISLRNKRNGKMVDTVNGEHQPDGSIILWLPVLDDDATMWSEATAFLAHEYGHTFTASESGAWNHADIFLDQFYYLKPIGYEDVKRKCLDEYQALMDIYTETGQYHRIDWIA